MAFGCNYNGVPVMVPFQYDERLSVYENMLALQKLVEELIKELERLEPELKALLANMEESMNKRMDAHEEKVEQEIKNQNTLIEVNNRALTTRMKRLETTNSNWRNQVEVQLANVAALQNARIEDLKMYVDKSAANINAVIFELNNLIVLMHNLSKGYTDEQIDLLKKDFAEFVSKQHGDLMLVTSPFTGLIDTLHDVLFDLYNRFQWLSLTAKEYDDLGLTAEEYDSMQISATMYDTRGWLLLFPKQFVEPIIEKCKGFVAELREELITRIEKLERKVSPTLSWVSGEYKDAYEQIHELVALTQHEAITAETYDAKGLTAETYDRLGLTGFDYDWSAYALLGR